MCLSTDFLLVSSSKLWNQVSYAVNNPGTNGLFLSLNICYELRRNGLSLSFVFNCKTLRSSYHTYLQICKKSNEVTSTSFCD